MMRIGTFLLTAGQLWRNMAETCSLLACVYQEAKLHVSVLVVGGPSEKLAAVNCQNRYPSPSKRSDPFPVRPLLPLGIGRSIAHTNPNAKKRFANMGFGGEYAATNKKREGERACRKNHGSLRLSRSRACRPAVTRRWSRALWVPAQAQVRPLSQVAMSERARSSVQPGTWHIARHIHRAAAKNLNTRLRALGNHQPSGCFPGGFFARSLWAPLGE